MNLRVIFLMVDLVNAILGLYIMVENNTTKIAYLLTANNFLDQKIKKN